MASISALLLFAGLLLGSNAQPIGTYHYEEKQSPTGDFFSLIFTVDADRRVSMFFYCAADQHFSDGALPLKKQEGSQDIYSIDYSGTCTGTVEWWYNKVRSTCPSGGKPPHFFPYHGKIVKGDLETLEFLSPNEVLTKFEGRTLSFSKIGQYLTPAVYHFSSHTFDILYEVYGINSPQPNDANIWMSVRCKNQPLHGRFQSEFQVSRTSSDTSIYVDKDYEIFVASVRRLNQLKFWLRRRCGITTSHDDFTKVRQEEGGRFAPEVVVTVLNGEEIYLRKLP